MIEAEFLGIDPFGSLRFGQVDYDYNLLSWLCCRPLSPDDFMWSVECPFAGLEHLLRHPREWVKKLNDLFGVSRGKYELELLPHFTIQMTFDDTDMVSKDRVQIDGISATGILRVVVSASLVHNATRRDGQWTSEPRWRR